MAPWKTQQTLPTLLLMNAASPWKIMEVMHHGSTERIKYKTESLTTWLDQALFTVTNIKKWQCAA